MNETQQLQDSCWVSFVNPTYIFRAATALEWIERRSLTNPSFAQQLQNNRGLDPGEASAIALAIELIADDLLIDQRLGHREALKLIPN